MIKSIIAPVCASLVALGSLTMAGAQSGPTPPPQSQATRTDPAPALPATPYLVASHRVVGPPHACAHDQTKQCHGILTITISSDRPAASTSTMLSLRQSPILLATRGEGQHSLLGGSIRPLGSCTGCGWWNFGCPGYYHEHVQWDEQDWLGVPIFHVALDTYDQTDCTSAWTVWAAPPSCSAYVVGWSCEPSPLTGVSWDGSYHHDYAYVKTKYVAVLYGVVSCEEDTTFLQNSLSPSGWVNGYASWSGSTC